MLECNGIMLGYCVPYAIYSVRIRSVIFHNLLLNPKRPGLFGQLDTRGGADSALFEKT